MIAGYTYLGLSVQDIICVLLSLQVYSKHEFRNSALYLLPYLKNVQARKQPLN